MTNQIETIMALATEYARAMAYDGDSYIHRDKLKQALEAALKPGEPLAHINSNGVVHAAGYPWSDSELLTPLFAAPPAQTPVEKS